LDAGRVVEECRSRLKQMLGGRAAERFVFTGSTTEALNLAILGVVRAARRRDSDWALHVVATDLDHNSVVRPLAEVAAADAKFSWTRVGAGGDGTIDPRAIDEAIRPETVLVVLNHASNVTGVVQPAREIAGVCRGRGVALLLDAAQSAGHVTGPDAIDLDAWGVDLCAIAGHKGLLGPAGVGGLYLAPGMEERVEPLKFGGTGTRSEEERQPKEMPQRYEAGTLNLPGIAGLSAALKWLLEGGAAEAAEREAGVREVMAREMGAIEAAGFGLVGALGAGRLPVYSFTHRALDSHEVAAILESEFGILARAGLQCAPKAHGGAAGSVRLSFGAWNTAEDAVRAAAALVEIGGAV
jgi:selenocysteine lyase/cysteine desulfurase